MRTEDQQFAPRNVPPSSGRTVLVTTHLFDNDAIAFLESRHCKVVTSGLPPGTPDTALPTQQLVELLHNVDAWIVGNVPVTRELLTRFPVLQIVARRGVGYDAVDVAAAKELGRVVTIAPNWNAPSVADHALALMLAVGRRLREFHARMQNGDWTILPAPQLFRKIVGLVGLGRIGRAVAQRLKGFEAKILAYDEKPDLGYGAMNGIRFVELHSLLRESDYISLHLPLTSEARNLIGASTLALMKRTAILVNTARGGLVDEHALLQALRRGQIAGAGLDVFLGEGDPAHLEIAHSLLLLPNVVATPHVAGTSSEGLALGNLITAQNVVTVLDGGSPPADCVVVDGRQEHRMRVIGRTSD